MVDMAADHPVDAPRFRLPPPRFLIAADIFDRVLDLVLQPGRQRPIGQAQRLARLEQQIVPATAPRHRPSRPAWASHLAQAITPSKRSPCSTRSACRRRFHARSSWIDLDAAEQPAGNNRGRIRHDCRARRSPACRDPPCAGFRATTWLCASFQNQRRFSCQPSTMSPTRNSVSHSLWARKSASASALQPRVPRWVSEMKMVR